MSPQVAIRPANVVGMRCPISDTAPYSRGIDPLARALAPRLNVKPRFIGTATERAERRGWSDDVRDAHGCLLEAGGQVDDALAAERFPLLLHPDCTIGASTLPVIARHRPDAKVLWLDAHGDFNTPETTESGWLGGMGLAAACGRWDAGLGHAPFEAGAVVLCGARDLDESERELLQASDVRVIGDSLETLVHLQNALDGAPVYVHLDPDVLDPEIVPAEHPSQGGLPPEKLFDLLDAVADSCEVVGLEITNFWPASGNAETAELAELLADTVEPLLPIPG